MGKRNIVYVLVTFVLKLVEIYLNPAEYEDTNS